MATVALIMAAGGSSYAALNLPANSVGSAQLRRGAVGTRQLRNHGVHVVDVAPSARRYLRGQRGPAGPPGVPVATYFAAVGSGGQFLRGNATHGGHTVGGSGVYTVGFAKPVTGCAFTATLGTTDGTPVTPGRVTVTQVQDAVEVHTFDAGGSPADLPFHLIVAC